MSNDNLNVVSKANFEKIVGGLKIYITSYSEEVTGSTTHVRVSWADGRILSFLVDCGLFQESEHNHINSSNFVFKPENIHFIVYTHPHTDHTGRGAYLVKAGFRGKAYCSYETSQIVPIVWDETAERLEDDYRKELKEYSICRENTKNRKLAAKGRGRKDKPRREKCGKKIKRQEEKVKHPVLIYTKEDIPSAVKTLVPCKPYESFEPAPGIEMTFYPNAHMAGAVLTVCRIYEEDEELYVLFTGDLGMTNPVTNVETSIPKEIAEKIDIIVCESTYGSSPVYRENEKEREKHMEIIKEVHDKRGTIVYMSNALERPLRLGVDLKDMQNDSKIKEEMKDFPIFLDSTFGLKCLNKYKKLYGDDYLPNRFKTVNKESRDIAVESNGPKMIICTSPRFYQGSFVNYAQKMLEDPNVTLIFVAYVPDDVKNIIALPAGTQIRYKGQMITLRCKRYRFGYYSSHVCTEQMDSFLSMFPNASTLLFHHGTHDSKDNYAIRYKTENNTTHNLLYGRTVLVNKAGIDKYF